MLRYREEEPRELHPRKCLDSREELVRLHRKWSKLRLLTFASQEVPEWQKVRVFNARKSSLVDRQIGDRRSVNLFERAVPGPSSRLPTGPLLCGLGSILVGCCTDRRDYYHQLAVFPEKAAANAVGARIPASSPQTKCPRLPLSRLGEKIGDGLGGSRLSRKAAAENAMLQPCFNSCFQGDHCGVEVATSAHEGVLQSVGLLQSPSRLQTRQPCPSGPAFESTTILC